MVIIIFKMIVNVVGTSKLHHIIDLHQLLSLEDVSYAPEKFSAAFIRLKVPKCTLLVFKNGNLVCTGGRSKVDLTNAVAKLARMLQELNYNLSPEPVVVTNVVAASNMSGNIDIKNLCKNKTGVSFDREIFPGARFKLPISGATVVLFASGKYYCTGTRSEQQALSALEEARRQLLPYVQCKCDTVL